MSLICCNCLHITIVSEHPDHYHLCHRCDIDKITPEQERMITESNEKFWRKKGV
jgi:hypothetical protein